ncbi:hypothetical protein DM860_010337 [Cuscuta australis]|uniref:Uncharacterized protein n=1 Tax=Cuscuta australis TaxID=267555 RepID=A0A328DCD4_9ASTE|nr:hypothetical protein DM860_010337 [Cuscuta australis]
MMMEYKWKSDMGIEIQPMKRQRSEWCIEPCKEVGKHAAASAKDIIEQMKSVLSLDMEQSRDHLEELARLLHDLCRSASLDIDDDRMTMIIHQIAVMLLHSTCVPRLPQNRRKLKAQCNEYSYLCEGENLVAERKKLKEQLEECAAKLLEEACDDEGEEKQAAANVEEKLEVNDIKNLRRRVVRIKKNKQQQPL